MSTQNSKMKASTIAIIALSVLLAIAVAATIVLAAFQATRTGTTTITFGEGLTLTIAGDGVTDNATENTFTITKPNLTNTGEILGEITATPSDEAYIAFSITPTVSSGFSIAPAGTGATATTYVYTITNTTNSHTATMTITIGDQFTKLADNDVNVVYTETTQNTGVALIDSVSISGNVNDLANLTIGGLVVQIGATTADATVTNAEAAIKLVDADATLPN